MKRILKLIFTGAVLLTTATFMWPSFATKNDAKTTSEKLKEFMKAKQTFEQQKLLLKKMQLPDDTIKGDTNLIYNFQDEPDNPLDYQPKSPLFLDNPEIYKTDYEYDPQTNEYVIRRKMGDLDYRRPYRVSAKEFRKYDFDRSMQNYWSDRVKADRSSINDRFSLLKLDVGIEGFDKIFGSNVIDIKPSGEAQLSFGVKISKIENPSLPLNLQRQITFDFDEDIKMGVTGSIGDKMQLGINYNTKATFDFENKTKLGYTGKEDEIIRSIEAGNVSLPLRGSLITGSQSLFGFKTQLQFGRLSVTSIFSQQKGKTSEIKMEGGAQINDFEVQAGDYEANRHFFLSHYFRDNYNEWMATLPLITSGINITRIEVWVTNRSNRIENNRNILALLDLAETYGKDGDANFYSPASLIGPSSNQRPQNEANQLYTIVTKDYSEMRSIGDVASALSRLSGNYGTDFTGGIHYEKIERARRLTNNEFTLNSQLGYITLNTSLNADEVLAVAFEYTTPDGNVYKVGEFSDGAVKAPNTLVLKLLKGTSLTPALPNWDLMMKNIYAIGAYNIDRQDFTLNILYKDDKIGTSVNYLKKDEKSQQKAEEGIFSKTLLQVMRLDRLNNQLDPQPDGMFDFVSGYTVLPQNGRVIFPVVEPFGSYLEEQILAENPTSLELQSIANRYTYQELYDSTQHKALQVAEKNKFLLQGTYLSEGGSEINLNAMNVAPGSVKVTAGGVPLVENEQYTVDYTMGRVTITDQSILSSGKPISVKLEDQAMFNIGTKTLLGTHLDYRFSDDFVIGGTMLRLTEKPLTSKVGFGEEPISNTIWGLDASYMTEAPFLTRFVDKFIPLVNTKERSTVSFEGEFAQLVPGHSKAIKKKGETFIADFEDSKTTIDLKSFPGWVLASTPMLQPEASLNDSLIYGYNRAKLAWYNVSIDLLGNRAPSHISDDEKSNHLVREVFEQELFPNRESEYGIPPRLTVLNLAYYPTERGPYNYDVTGEEGYSAGLSAAGELKDPESRWGGIMRRLQTNDFEAQNIEFIEFWLMDPFVYNEDHNGGELYFNLGNVSEDILKDSRKTYENGLTEAVDTTNWGLVPATQAHVDAFDNNPEKRREQDVGLDGLDDENEREFFSSEGRHSYLDKIIEEFGVTSQAYEQAYGDPSADNYHYFRGTDYDQQQVGILQRYKDYNGHEGNSPSSEDSPEDYPTSGSLLPDAEDINRDKTLNESESYYQYSVKITPEDMEVGKNFITDMVVDSRKRTNGETTTVKWYQFRIPLFDANSRETVGTISDFKSIRFMRMFLKGFDEEVVLRFGELHLVRGEWRKYNYDLTSGGETNMNPQHTQGTMDITAVNIEENANRSPVNYVLPPDVTREIDPQNPQMQQLNEQSLVLKVMNLEDGDARAAYKNVNLDMRQFRKLQMYAHAEAIEACDVNLQDYEVTAFIRIGSDYQENYYEYEVPMKLTEPNKLYDNDIEEDRYMVWPADNQFEIDLEILQRVKQMRNNEMRYEGSSLNFTHLYSIMDGTNRVTIKGNPNLSDVRTIMLGIRNPDNSIFAENDGFSKCVEIWLNELRLTDFREEGGWAANSRMVARLADFATVTMTGNTSKPGFGSIEKKVNERQKEEIIEYDLSSTIQLGKFFPKSANVNIPLYLGYSESFVNPEYNPLDPDIPLKATLNDPNLTEEEKDSVRFYAQDYTKRKSVNITNVRVGNLGGGKPHFYNLSNFTTSFAFSEMFVRNIHKEYDLNRRYYGMLAYNYSPKTKPWTPLSKYPLFQKFTLLRDFNLYFLPRQLGFRSTFDKQYKALKFRNLNNPDIILDPSFQKDFMWHRDYTLKYDITRNLKLDFIARNISRIDEPEGAFDRENENYENYRDTIWQQIFQGGRTMNYNHKIALSYNVPLNKIKLLSWINANVQYGATYDWMTGLRTPLKDLDGEDIDFGNVIKNTNNIQTNTTFNLKKIYDQVEFLRDISNKYNGRRQKQKQYKTVSTTKRADLEGNKPKIINHRLGVKDVSVEAYDLTVTKNANGKTDTLKVKLVGRIVPVDENKVEYTVNAPYDDVLLIIKGKKEVMDNPFKIAGELLVNSIIGLKSISVRYSENNGTNLPGFKPSPKYFGLNEYEGKLAPGIPFALGWQDTYFAGDAAENGWLIADTRLSAQYAVAFSNNLNLTANYEPLPDMKIYINATRNERYNYQAFYSPESEGSNVVEEQNKSVTGSLSMSYFTWQTAFEKLEEENDYYSETFETFKENRRIIAHRLAEHRALEDNDYDPFDNPRYDTNENEPERFSENSYYRNGYGPLSQEVLLPAFLAAYTKRSPENIALDVVPDEETTFQKILGSLPMPNWRIQYRGLAKLELLKNYVRRVEINHSYKSLFTLAGYREPLTNEVRDELQNFIPQYEIPGGVSIREDFSPLAKLDITWKNNLITNLEYRKQREMNLSFTDNRLREMHNNEIIFGTGIRFTEVPLTLVLPGGDKSSFKSDLDIRVDFSFKDMTSIIRSLDEETEEDKSDLMPGSQNISIKTTADYRLNERFSIRLYYDHIFNTPKISTAYPTQNMKVGFTIRFNLIP